MPITNQQGNRRVPRTKAEKDAQAKVDAAIEAEVELSIARWRALTGLPPKESRRG